MTKTEHDECYAQLISNCVDEAKRLAGSNMCLEGLAIKAALSGNYYMEAVANEAMRIAARSR